jgi:hypothetical protein
MVAKSINLIVVLAIFIYSSTSVSHKKKKQTYDPSSNKVDSPKEAKIKIRHNKLEEIKKLELKKETYKKINKAYLSQIKPIFQKKCFDCHSNQTVYPWYYKIPGVKQLIDDDISEAKEHLDFTSDFPFLGHEGPYEDLLAIKKTTQEETMPPLRYRIMHWKSYLTDTDKKLILKWISQSIKEIKIN